MQGRTRLRATLWQHQARSSLTGRSCSGRVGACTDLRATGSGIFVWEGFEYPPGGAGLGRLMTASL